MNTPTPWTDANEEDGWNPCGWAVDSNLVRELERERDKLATALERILEYQGRFAEEDPESIATEALQSLTKTKP